MNKVKGAKILFFGIFVLISLVGLVSAVSWNINATNTTYMVTEDVPYVHNFTANITDYSVSDISFAVHNTEVLFLLRNGLQIAYSLVSNWIYFTNSTTGMFLLNATLDNETGNFSIPVEASSSGGATTTLFFFNITPVNDAPRFIGLENKSFNRSELFEYKVNITDEENNFPFSLNISFLNCTVAAWSIRNCSVSSNRTLFNSSQYTFNGTAGGGWFNISFIPERNDVGNYTINFTVTDSGNTTQPHNASRSQIVLFEVLNINEMPYFTYVCGANQTANATEDTEFSCYINATDIDEIHNLTFVANYSWFNFSESNTSSVSISGQYNFSTLVRINASDSSVGNWVVNISLSDTNLPAGTNSTLLYFNISNKNDSVSISDIPNQTGVTSDNKIIQINATDNDLLIPDKSVYNESLTFISDNVNVTISNLAPVPGTNRMNATLTINTANWLGEHIINITVQDANNYSVSSDTFMVNITGNNAPQWKSETPTYFVLNEDVAFSYNLTANVTDADAIESLTFSSTINGVSDYPFGHFPLDISNGIISFTPLDEDVGYHNVTITVTDSRGSSASRDFNFTVYNNFSDMPSFSQFYITNGTVNETTRNITLQEDNLTTVLIQVLDNDFCINDHQGNYGFYMESLAINVTLQGPNTALIVFSSLSPPGQLIDTEDFCHLIQSDSYTFTPRKGDVGQYNFTFNVTDAYGNSFARSYNVTVLETGHAPVLTDISNQIFSVLNENMYIDVNGSDLEDGNDTLSGDGNLTFTLTSLTSGGNFLTINTTTGIMNFTFNQTHAGLWAYRLAVNDTENNEDFDYFNVTVYDYPKILTPSSSYTFSLQENVTSLLNFSANHSVQDSLTYAIYINGSLKNSTSGYGNSSDFLLAFKPNFTDETTCTGSLNLTLNVSNAKLSNTTYWTVNINHTNYPLSFLSAISAQSGGSPITLSLSSYFTDIDASDSCVNQTATFSYTLVPNSTSGGTITVGFQNWVNGSTPLANFSSTAAASANYSITAIEYNVSNSSQPINNVSSNNFSVSLTVASAETPSATSSGGGGSRTVEKIISLKILVPEPVSAKHGDRLVIPLGLVNDGSVDLRGIVLSAVIAKDGLLRRDLIASFDKSTFASLSVGERENVTLIVDVETNATGIFEVTINATVEDPVYSDWAKFYIEIQKEEDVLERIIFTEEFIIGNPECAEFVDLIDEAKALFTLGRLKEAMQKANDSLDACRQAITQPPRPRSYSQAGGEFFTYAAIASLIAFVLGFIYYEYKKIRLRRQLRGY